MASGGDTVAKIAEATATNKATASQLAFNAALLANPVTWAIVGITAFIAGIAALVKGQREAIEQQIEYNKTVIE